jgi:hypothetical protein
MTYNKAVHNWFSDSGPLASWNWCACTPNTTQIDFQHSAFVLQIYTKSLCWEFSKSWKMDELCILHLSCWQPEASKWARALDRKQRINYARPNLTFKWIPLWYLNEELLSTIQDVTDITTRGNFYFHLPWNAVKKINASGRGRVVTKGNNL